MITADQFRACMDLLEATEACDKCGGDGNMLADDVAAPWCDKCEGTGQMRVIR